MLDLVTSRLFCNGSNEHYTGKQQRSSAPSARTCALAGKSGGNLEEENEQIYPGGTPFLLPVQGAGGGEAAEHPAASWFGVGCEDHGFFAIRHYNIFSCWEEGQFLQGSQAFLPKSRAN